MTTYLSTADIVARGIPGLQHPVTVVRKLEEKSLCGFQSKKGGRWSVREDCLTAYVERRPCAHKSNVVPLHRTA